MDRDWVDLCVRRLKSESMVGRMHGPDYIS